MKEPAPTNHSVTKFVIATLLGLFMGITSGWMAYLAVTLNSAGGINGIMLIIWLYVVSTLIVFGALLLNGSVYAIIINFIYGEKTHKRGRIDTYFGLLGLLTTIATYFIFSVL